MGGLLSNFLPSASRYVRSYYWLYLGAALVPAIVDKLYQMKEGKFDMGSFLDWAIFLFVILGVVIGTTKAYVDQHREEES